MRMIFIIMEEAIKIAGPKGRYFCGHKGHGQKRGEVFHKLSFTALLGAL